MVDGLVIAGIIILGVLAFTELVYIFFLPGSREERTQPRTFTVLLYRKENTDFAAYLRSFLSRARWSDGYFSTEIYVVHENIPEQQSSEVRALCEQEPFLIYCSREEFADLMFPEKNSAEKDCNLSEKIV